MPQVHLRITQEHNSASQKAALIQGITELLVDVLGKNPDTTMITIEELPSDNWGIGGRSVTERRLASATPSKPSINSTPITGKERHQGLSTPIEALSTFYAAFNERDLSLMRQVWLADDEPSMDNPIGGIRRGWPEIEQGYQKLFGGEARVHVEFYDYTEQVFGDVAVFVGRERGTCALEASMLDLAIRTTRLFVLHEGEWRQLHHHGSVEDPGLLARYQALIFSPASLNRDPATAPT